MLDTQPAAVPIAEQTVRRYASPDLTRIAEILVDRLQQAGVDLHAGPSLDEMKQLLVELVRSGREGAPLPVEAAQSAD